MTRLLIGFVIALAVGLTGIGGGSFTVPALLLFAGLSAGEAVGTSFVFIFSAGRFTQGISGCCSRVPCRAFWRERWRFAW